MDKITELTYQMIAYGSGDPKNYVAKYLLSRNLNLLRNRASIKKKLKMRLSSLTFNFFESVFRNDCLFLDYSEILHTP